MTGGWTSGGMGQMYWMPFICWRHSAWACSTSLGFSMSFMAVRASTLAAKIMPRWPMEWPVQAATCQLCRSLSIL